MLLRPRLQSATRRHRRGLAAAAAAIAMLAALTALRGAPAPAQVLADDGTGPALRAGEVAVPVALASADLAATVTPGDLIDVVAVPRDPGDAAVVLADRARVLRPAAGGTLGGSASSIVLLAVPDDVALSLSAAVGDVLTVVIRTG